ncbi:MAG: hypothetical protein GY822_00850 [Deltaproteobacteria bacterium]|nr:hypothetical protein [Deltaproteobacteria bacterium]
MANNKNNTPSYLNVMHGKEIGQGKGAKTMWTKCGVAFPLKDKPGFSLVLEYIPMGKPEFVLLPPLEKKED